MSDDFKASVRDHLRSETERLCRSHGCAEHVAVEWDADAGGALMHGAAHHPIVWGKTSGFVLQCWLDDLHAGRDGRQWGGGGVLWDRSTSATGV